MKKRVNRKCIGTDSRGRQKGAVSVEASLVFPLFFFCIMLFSRLFLLIMTECLVAEKISEATVRMAPLAYGERAVLKEKASASSLLFYSEIYALLDEVPQLDNLRLLCVDSEDSNVFVTVSYDFPMQAVGFPALKIKVKQSFMLHPYIGEYDEDLLEDSEPLEKGDKVYITEGGQVYHLKRTCTYLFMPAESVSIGEITDKRNGNGAKYYPCERCKDSRNTGMVYITNYGNRYHLKAECPALFRDVKEVEKTSVSDRRPCSKCGKEESENTGSNSAFRNGSGVIYAVRRRCAA